ncbi:uncharacterized protein UV8b_06022 [Ustilaginoidea virens]|uniref:FAD dependent oxidoreductase n=1 Tax=Ustilaginoidea virens TaxID=1159556 RepID=A0A8E5HUI9_USTVR|nr:uncharacterized protein UV8b_06022 [Ustilaginoidea virens]QUC21778.1 hypothetical protein UV8b_06022 [Ustilaginoidea virens]
MEVPKIQRVAVVGAGASGILSAAHLIAAGLDVVVFERNSGPGGVWLYDERKIPRLAYPSTKASRADVQVGEKLADDEALIMHAPPGPCYRNLKTNVPTPLMEVTLLAWPPCTPDYADHHLVQQYLYSISMQKKVHEATSYGARVQKVEKKEDGWLVMWTSLQSNEESLVIEKESASCFDAVVVANGHYHAPRIPDIPGLSQAKQRYGSRIMHSKEYRRPEDLKSKTVLMIGGGVSSVDIATDISPFANSIYQSTRNSHFDLDAGMLPRNATRVDEIALFEIHDDNDTLCADDPLPVSCHLDYHSDETRPENASDRILVSDGTQVHNLHKDMFYIHDPTLAFVGLPYYTFTFSVFDFQAIVVAQVLSGLVELPTKAEMRSEYEAKVLQVGHGRNFHSIHGKEEAYVADILSWANANRVRRGLNPIAGFPPKWYEAKEALRRKFRQDAEKRASEAWPM